MTEHLLQQVWRCIWPSWLDAEQAAVEALLKSTPPGALTLFSRHLPDLETALDLNHRLLRLSQGQTRIAVDEEGGPVRRLPEPFPAFPAARTWAETEATTETVEQQHFALGELLGRFGFAIDFAPVCDLEFDRDHPALRERCFARQPETVAAYAAAATRGLQAAGLSACAKHFPGHGAVAADSHDRLDTLDRSLDTVQAEEFVAFQGTVTAGCRIIMAAHCRWPDVDDTHPTTFSRNVTQTARTHLGFSGVLLTDDLEMGAIAAQWPREEAALLALTSGYDAVLYCKSLDIAQAAAEICVKEAESSAAFRDLLTTAAGRIERLPQIAAAGLLQRADIASALSTALWR